MLARSSSAPISAATAEVNWRKPPETIDHPRAARPHRPGEGARAGIELDAALQHVVDDADRQAREQRDALAQRRLEVDLAAHRPLGDRGDVVAEAHDGRELVDAFLADQGRIHVGHEQPLLAPCERLDDHVDRLAREMRARARRASPRVSR